MPGKQVELGAEFMHGDATAIAVLAARHRLRLWWLCTWAQVCRLPCHAVGLSSVSWPRRWRCGCGCGSRGTSDCSCALTRACAGGVTPGRWRPAFREGPRRRMCLLLRGRRSQVRAEPHAQARARMIAVLRDADRWCAAWPVLRLARFDEIDEDQETLHEALWSISEADEGAFVGKHGRRNVTQVRSTRQCCPRDARCGSPLPHTGLIPVLRSPLPPLPAEPSSCATAACRSVCGAWRTRGSAIPPATSPRTCPWPTCTASRACACALAALSRRPAPWVSKQRRFTEAVWAVPGAVSGVGVRAWEPQVREGR